MNQNLFNFTIRLQFSFEFLFEFAGKIRIFLRILKLTKKDILKQYIKIECYFRIIRGKYVLDYDDFLMFATNNLRSFFPIQQPLNK